MHKDRILALADLIEQQPHTSPSSERGFTMADFTHDCGTPACLAGWAAWESENRPEVIEWSLAASKATQFLCIGYDMADELFEPDDIAGWDRITPAHAAFTLRHLAETGVVDWSAYPGKDGTNDQQ